MNFDQEITLNRDTLATIIPAGKEYTIPAGTVVSISQALGGAVTVRTAQGLYRIPSRDWDALGAELKEYLNETSTQLTQAKLDQPFSKDLVWDALKQCFDPEIPLNCYQSDEYQKALDIVKISAKRLVVIAEGLSLSLIHI